MRKTKDTFASAPPSPLVSKFSPPPAIFLLQPRARVYRSRLTQGRGRSSGVEHYLAKVRVESSNLFARSIFSLTPDRYGAIRRGSRSLPSWRVDQAAV